MNNNIDYIKNRLKEYKKKFYTRELVNGTIIFFSIVLFAYLSVILVEYIGNFNTNTRTILFFTFVAIAAYATVKHLGIPIKKLLNNDKELNDQEASEQIGDFFPEIKDKLLNTIQLSGLNFSQNALINASIDQRSQELKPFQFNQAVSFDNSKSLLIKYLSIPVLLFIILFLFNRKTITSSTERIVNFNQEYVPQAPFSFSLYNQDLSCFQGENLELKLNLSGSAIPENVYLVSAEGRYLMSKIGADQFNYTLYNVQNSSKIWFEAAGFNSVSYEINLLKRPGLKDIKLSLSFPKYLKKTNSKLENIGSFSVPEGTDVQWNVKTNETNNVSLIFSDSLKIQAKRADENTFSFQKTFKENTDYEIQLANANGNNKEPIVYQIEVIKDKYPGIELENYSDTLLYSYILVGGNIYDDYGLTALKLFYRVNNKDKEPENYKNIPIPIQSYQNNQNFVYQFVIDSLKLKPGDEIDYYLQVWDNDGVNGRKSAKSGTKGFRIPSKKEIKEKFDQNSEQNKEQLNAAIEKSAEINEELKKLSDQFKTQKKLSWQDKKDIEKTLQKQRELQSEIKQLQEEIKTAQEKKDRFEELDPETEEKLKQLEDILQNLVDEETQKLMDELQKLLENETDLDEINEKLDELNNKEESFEKELDRTLELYKQLEFEQKLEQTIDDLNELAEKQEQLQEQTEDSKSKENLEDIKEQQDELNKEFDDLKKELDQLNDLNEELENKKDLNSLEEQEKNAEENMQNSSEELSKKNKKNAAQSQKNAADKLKKMAQQMQEMQAQQEQEALQENIDDLRNVLDNLITLSFDQEDVMTEIAKVKRKDPRFVELSQQQLKLERDSEIIEDSLYALAKRVFQLESIITKELTNMTGALQESSKFIKQRKANRAAVKQQYAMTSMNNLALLLDDLLDQLQQDLAQQSEGDQMCDKPGQGKPGKGKPGKLGDMQQQLNDMIKQLKEGKKEGKSMSGELAKLAARQEMLRRELKKLGKNGKDGKQNQKVGDNLKKLEQAMEETEKELLNKNLSEKTIKRQQDILTRLLEAENASREREYDNKRESKEATKKTNLIPPSYDKYIKEKEKQIELLQTIPPNLNPYYKQEVNEYFDKIEY